MTESKLSNKVDWKKITNPGNLIITLIGTSLAVFAMKGFMIPNRFLDGGITGISILIHEIFHVNISIPVIILNSIFVYLGYHKIGKTFAMQTAIAVVLLSIGLYHGLSV